MEEFEGVAAKVGGEESAKKGANPVEGVKALVRKGEVIGAEEEVPLEGA